MKGQLKEIERKRQKRDKETLERNPQPLFLFPLILFRREAPPPRRTLGDYAMHQGSRHFSSIAIPATTRFLEMKPVFLSLI